MLLIEKSKMNTRQIKVGGVIIQAFLVIFTLISFSSGLRAFSPSSTIQIISPSHPRTFYIAGYPKISQDLSWEKKDGVLTGKVTYSLVMSAGDELLDPANYRTFDLPFPGVHLNAKDRLYLQRKARIVDVGYLEEGAFGTQVKLNDNVHFAAHRRDGELSGELVIFDAH
jgi:hypothetical protein